MGRIVGLRSVAKGGVPDYSVYGPSASCVCEQSK